MSPPGSNPLFLRLAIVSGWLAVASVAAYTFSSRIRFRPEDEVDSFCYCGGLLIALLFLALLKDSEPWWRGILRLTASLGLFFVFWQVAFRLELARDLDDYLTMFIIPGLATGTAWMVVAGRGTILSLFSRKFLSVLLRGLPAVSIYWSFIALAGFWVVNWLDFPYSFDVTLQNLQLPENIVTAISDAVQPVLSSFKLNGDGEWLHICLFLIASALTLVTWHVLWLRLGKREVPSGSPGIPSHG